MQNFKEFSLDEAKAFKMPERATYEKVESHTKKTLKAMKLAKVDPTPENKQSVADHKAHGRKLDALRNKQLKSGELKSFHSASHGGHITESEETLTEEEDDKIFKNPNAKIKGASFKDASMAEHKKAIQYHKDEARRVSSSASISTGSRMSKTAFHNMRAKLHADHLKSIKESAICTHCQSDPCICDDSHGFVSEAAQGHTIEAHGIRGMKGTPWRKTFKSHEHLSDWADKNDSIEVHATRELDGVKKKTNEEAELDEVFADQGSGSTAKDNAEYMKRRKAAGATKHKVSVTVSEKDHPMVSKRLEKQHKRVIVSADSKEEAVVRAKKFYSKQGYHVHDAEYHSPQSKTSMKTESVVPSFNEFVSEMWHAGDSFKRDFKRREMEHELGHEDRAEKESGNSSHAVHINGKKWKSFATKSHAQNVANKIKGATVHKEEYVDENASLDKYKKYTRPVVKTTPKIERTTNPAGRTTDHVEWKVTTDTGEIVRHKSKKEAQAHFDSLPK